jgi:nicotinate phosphoribosyltransferase
MTHSALLTDLYELTMIQGYYLEERNPRVIFDMFYRNQPFSGGFSLFAGLQPLLENLEAFSFSTDDLEYLDSTGLFKGAFLSFLEDFRFNGDVYAMKEGEVIFPGEPLLRVHGSLIEAQLVESMLLNVINFQSLVASKAARIYLAGKRGKILEFGLRRAQGWDGALSASRAAYIGGAAATSNTLAGKIFGIPVSGTMAHSWVMAFQSELEAFEKFAELYPDKAILLIDTYDSLGSGLEHAITVGKKLKEKGKRLGVRLDSGDLSYLSQKVRKRLDEEGLDDALIAVSNDLNEEIIHQLVTEGAPIDLWGVGTHLVTGGSSASFSGVYKLAAKESRGMMLPTIKVSNNIEKTTNPGKKQVYRFFDAEGAALADLIALEDQSFDFKRPHTFYHPLYPSNYFTLSRYGEIQPLLKARMIGGSIRETPADLDEIRHYALQRLDSFDRTYKRIINPHIYKVSLSTALKNLKLRMIDETRS